MTLWQIIRDAAERFPNRVAVTSAGRDFTYAELDDRVERLAAAFQTQGLGPGDRVPSLS